MKLSDLLRENPPPVKVKMPNWIKGKWFDARYVIGGKAIGHDQDLKPGEWALSSDFVLYPPTMKMWRHMETGILAQGLSCPDNMPGPWLETSLTEMLKQEEG